MELLSAADDLRKAYAKTGSASEIEQLRNDVMECQTRITAIRASARIDLSLRNENDASDSRSSISGLSKTSSTSSKRMTKRMELERKKAEVSFEKVTDITETQRGCSPDIVTARILDYRKLAEKYNLNLVAGNFLQCP